MANQIEYVISAVDRTKTAFTSVQNSLGKLQDSAQSIQRAFSGLAALGAIGALGTSLKNSIGELAALDDAAEATGASVESLSSLLNTLRPSGASLEQITDIAGKLARSMAGAGDETSKAAEAFKAIGVSTRDVAGNLRPVDEVLREVAVALNQYEDGSNKVALAQALLTKSGAQYLPLLKDLATEQARAATVTSEQAAEAERAEKAFRRLSNEFSIMRNEIVSALLPGFNDLLVKLRAFAEIGSAPKDLLAAVLGDPAKLDAAIKQREDKVRELTALQTELAGKLGETPESRRGVRAGLQDQINEVNQAAQQEGLRLNQLLALRQRRAELERSVESSPAAGGRQAPRLRAEASADRRADATREQASEAERLLQTLTQQLDKTRDLTTEQEVLARIGRNEIGGLTPTLEQQILLRAVQIDKVKEEQKAREDLKRTIDALADAEAVEQRTRADALRAIEVGPQLEAWQRYKSLLGETTEAQRKQTQAVLDLIVAQREAGSVSEATAQQMIDRLLQIPKEAEEGSSAVRELGLTFTSAFEDAVVNGKKLSEVLQSLGQDILRIVLRKSVTEPLVEGLLGKGGAGGFLSSALSSVFGGARASGGPVGAGMTYLVGEKGPELLTLGGMGGYVTPNNMIAAGGDTINVNLYGFRGDQTELRRSSAQIGSRVSMEVGRSRRTM